jgi:hypothetical protein
MPHGGAAIIPSDTIEIEYDVLPRALNFCHLMLGKHWCDKFKVVFGVVHLDPSIFWNGKNMWLAHTDIKKFQEIRRQNLCLHATTNTTPQANHVLIKPRVRVE